MPLRAGAPTWVSLLLAFGAWIIALAGLAATQNQCTDTLGSGADYLAGVDGISSNLVCTRVYRYYWYIIGYQFCLLALALGVIVAGAAKQTAASVAGLLTVGLVLCIQFTNTFLSASDFNPDSGALTVRLRVTTAGACMMAITDVFLIWAFGSPWQEVEAQPEVRAEVI